MKTPDKNSDSLFETLKLTKDSYPKYTKNFHASIIRQTTKLSKNLEVLDKRVNPNNQWTYERKESYTSHQESAN